MKSRRIWRTGLIALGILAGAWAFAALLLPVLWPFLIGLAVSLLAEKPVRLLQTRAKDTRDAGFFANFSRCSRIWAARGEKSRKYLPDRQENSDFLLAFSGSGCYNTNILIVFYLRVGNVSPLFLAGKGVFS